jgi:hypothetical protein
VILSYVVLTTDISMHMSAATVTSLLVPALSVGACCDACADSTAVTIMEEPAAAEQALSAPAEADAAAAAEDDEFDYSAELEAASAAVTAADAAAASPQQSPRSPMLPPPPPVDDSPAHIREYLSTVCGALLEALPDGTLPARIQPAQVCGLVVDVVPLAWQPPLTWRLQRVGMRRCVSLAACCHMTFAWPCVPHHSYDRYLPVAVAVAEVTSVCMSMSMSRRSC